MIQVNQNVQDEKPSLRKSINACHTIFDLFEKSAMVPVSKNGKKTINGLDFIKAYSSIDLPQIVQIKHDIDVNADHNHFNDNESKNVNLFAGSKTMVSPHPSELPMPPKNWL